MIDTELITKAKKKSSLIEKIDVSWREFVEGLKEGTFTFPFKGGYNCMIKGRRYIYRRLLRPTCS